MFKAISLILGLFFINPVSFENFAPPSNPIYPYLNGVFPTAAPGGTWELEDPAPNLTFQGPLRIIPFPNSEDYLVLCKGGEVWQVSFENQTKTLILDIKDRAFKLGEAGTTGIALHPKFGDPTAPDQQKIFIFYRTKPDADIWSEKGFNRLAKFDWNPQTSTFDPNTEEILFQQYDRFTWHNGGAMFFGPDEFLYLSLGDEGDDPMQAASTQRLDGGFFSGILRIDVDNDPTRSHPIIRQPIPNENPPTGWGETYSQGYSIPNDNPWLSPDGSHLEEFYALGLRSPYGMFFDPITEKIWVSDTGSFKHEEINVVEKAENLQWPYMEGTSPSDDHQRPTDLIGFEREVYYEFERATTSCVIGGSVYQGTQFPQLTGKYLLADYNSDKIMCLTDVQAPLKPELEILIDDIAAQDVDVPESPGITGINSMPDGEILVTVMGEDYAAIGKIFRLVQKADVPDPPVKLSELGVFSNMNTLETAEGIFPYTVNTPLWSDRALKKRWMAIPNDGVFDSAEEQINFNSKSEWDFPEGTVFIKHFDLPLDTDSDENIVKLETRFFIIGENGKGYGLTYKWNDEGTEAYLQGGGTSKDFDIYEGGQFSFTQTWDYPSRNQCLTCHTNNANYILGVKTHQLNGDFYYEELNQTMNQLEFLNEANMFHKKIGDVQDLPKSYAIDDESVDLQIRVRSYLDANCSSCHRPGGVPMITLDYRLNTPLRLQNIINIPTQSHASNQDNLIVRPGSHETSEIWIRDASLTENRMPPLARNLVDEVYIAALTKWIDNFKDEDIAFSDVLIYPNPSSGLLNLRMVDEWVAPFGLKVFDLSGRLMHQESSDLKVVQMDLSRLSGGTYFIEIESLNQRTVKKFLIR